MDADADQLQLYIFILEQVSLHLLAKLLLIGYPSQTKGFSSRWEGLPEKFY